MQCVVNINRRQQVYTHALQACRQSYVCSCCTSYTPQSCTSEGSRWTVGSCGFPPSKQNSRSGCAVASGTKSAQAASLGAGLVSAKAALQLVLALRSGHLRHLGGAAGEARHLIAVLAVLSNAKAARISEHILQQLRHVRLGGLVGELDAVLDLCEAQAGKLARCCLHGDSCTHAHHIVCRWVSLPSALTCCLTAQDGLYLAWAYACLFTCSCMMTWKSS